MPDNRNKLKGILLGTALGDSLGLTFEGISAKDIPGHYSPPLEQSFIAGKGFTSDDTDHSYFVARSLFFSSDSSEKFASNLAWYLRLWILTAPAGVGFATLRSSILLLLGFSPQKSGVFSAGNGPAMRSAIIGGFFSKNPELRSEFVKTSTVITHTDPRALIGAKAVAELAALFTEITDMQLPPAHVIFEILRNIDKNDSEWQSIIDKLTEAKENNLDVEDFAKQLCGEKGISGYTYQTVPMAIYSLIRHNSNFDNVIEHLIMCGGDTDTVCAISGALWGSLYGETMLPERHIKNLCEWPRTASIISKAAEELSNLSENRSQAKSEISYFWPALPARNLVFLIFVFAHILRRLFKFW
ncbi:MAG: ADP-ribosylglycohydrolase family protein [Candidatus Riflebacteria bacterium]|nr:ADP-ribosylglycohydrolase family protein [Candidatus Riflebacteria bacterium]